jgi:hypothetical protein
MLSNPTSALPHGKGGSGMGSSRRRVSAMSCVCYTKSRWEMSGLCTAQLCRGTASRSGLGGTASLPHQRVLRRPLDGMPLRFELAVPGRRTSALKTLGHGFLADGRIQPLRGGYRLHGRGARTLDRPAVRPPPWPPNPTLPSPLACEPPFARWDDGLGECGRALHQCQCAAWYFGPLGAPRPSARVLVSLRKSCTAVRPPLLTFSLVGNVARG